MPSGYSKDNPFAAGARSSLYATDNPFRPLSPEEWKATLGSRPTLDTTKAARIAGAGFTPDASRQLPEKPLTWAQQWKRDMTTPSIAEDVALGVASFPFAVAKAPVEAAKGIVRSAAHGFDADRLGRWVAERVGHGTRIVSAEMGMRAADTPYRGPLKEVSANYTDPVSDAEAASIALNLGLMAMGERGSVAATDVRAPRPGIRRIPEAQAAERLANRGTIDEVLNQLRDPVATSGDVPLNPALPPATRAYPMGATTGDLLVKGVRKPFTEPLPTPYARGVGRRPAEAILSPEERKAAVTPETPVAELPIPLRPTVEAIPSIGEPVSVGRDPLSPVVNRRGTDPTFNQGIDLPDEIASFGAVQSRTPKGAMPKDVPLPTVGETEIPALRTATQDLPAPSADASTIATTTPQSPREFINYARLKLSQTAESRVRSMVEEMRARGDMAETPMTFEDMAKVAKDFKDNYLADPLALDHTRLQKMSGIEAQAIKSSIRDYQTMIDELSSAVMSKELSPTEVAEATQLIDAANQATRDLLPTLKRKGTEAGQNLVAFRQDAKLSLSPDVWLLKAQRMLGDNAVMSDELMTKIRRLAREAGEACA